VKKNTSNQPDFAATIFPVGNERRRFPRSFMEHSWTVIPTFPDGAPNQMHRMQGTGLNLSPDGIGLDLPFQGDLPGNGLVVLVESGMGVAKCAGLELIHAQQVEPGVLRIGGRFGGIARQLLDPENLLPKFDLKSMKFVLGFSEEVLNQWVELGVLKARVTDRVQLCPKCHGLPSFRQGCARCGSAWITNDRLIHHFACAHVGHADEFEVGRDLVCPKCRTTRLVVGADYEWLTGPFHCLDCQWSDTVLEQVAQCLRCGFRFPGHRAFEQELRGYDVNRLDPLALLPSSGTAARIPVGAASGR
jgi:TackOD1 domain-containing protein